jgi:hypothetical protein
MAASFCSVAPPPSRPDGCGRRCSDGGTRSNPGLSTNTVRVFATTNVLRIRRCFHEGSEPDASPLRRGPGFAQGQGYPVAAWSSVTRARLT